MQKILTAEEMREVDRLTTEKYGIPSILLMENAAHAAARVITEKLGGSVKGKSFLILCGKGNNGGDGAALGRILWTLGASVQIILFGKVADTKGDARVNFEIAQKHERRGVAILGSKKGLKCFYLHEVENFDSFLTITKNLREDVCIDAIFGTGSNRKAEGDLEQVIAGINNYSPFGRTSFIVSLDLPSGVNADSAYYYPIDFGGEEIENDSGTAAQPSLTITFTAPKIANVLPPVCHASREFVTVDIGSPESIINASPSKLFLAERDDAKSWLGNTRYQDDSYKNKRGHALLIVGSREYAGAAVLAGNAAMLSGVGLTTIATSESAQTAIAAKVLEEVITCRLPETRSGAIAEKAFETIEKLIEKIDAVGIGCGLNSDEKTTRDFVREVVEKRKTPVVIDADALNALSPFELKGSDVLPLILTPHEGEFLRLLGTKDKAVLKDRVQAVRDFAVKHHAILVLKGERTLIAAPNGTVVVNPTGNSGLGKAGNGDTLTGIVTGFIAQTMQTEHFKSDFEFNVGFKPIQRILETVVAAVYVSGLAGDIAARKFGKRSMLASDVRECLGEAFRELEY